MKKRRMWKKAASLALAGSLLVSALGISAAATASEAPEDGLVLYYDMEQVEDGILVDAAGQYNATIHGAAAQVGSFRGKALQFDGSDDYVELAAALQGELAGMSAFTVSAFVKLDELRGYQRIFDWGNGQNAFQCMIAPSTNTWNAGLCYDTSNTGGGEYGEQWVSAPESPQTGQWFHVAVSQEADGMTALYVNGLLVAEKEISLAPRDVVREGDVFLAYLGKSLWNDPLLKGSMDEFRLYDRALQADEIARLASLDDDEKLAIAKEALEIPAIAYHDLTLPAEGLHGVEITWTSSRPEILSPAGKVTRPTDGDQEVRLTATLYSQAESCTRDFFVLVPVEVEMEGAEGFALDQVELLDETFLTKEGYNREVMDKISADTVLYAFRYNANTNYGANLDYNGASHLDGWAHPAHVFTGHYEGHYMSALAMLYARYKDPADKAKMDAIVEGLAEVQTYLKSPGDNEGDPDVVRGYLSAFPETRFDTLENHQYAAVPWYMIHKIMAGLLDIYRYGGNEQALELAEGMASWAEWRMERLGDKAEEVLSYEEYGGMNEVLLNLYQITGNTDYQEMASLFEERARLFDDLADGVDNLTGLHGNTYLAKVVGLARNYQITQDDYYRRAVENFWSFVVEDGRTYVNGGNTIWENFGAANTLSQQLNGNTAETCNVYNLLKISRDAFGWSKDVKYLDYYEQGLLNQILGSIVEDGSKTYYQNMGVNQVMSWNDPFLNCACCNGTGLENFSKLNDSLYFHDGSELFVAQYIASRLTWDDQGAVIRMDGTYPYSDTVSLTFEEADGRALTLQLRIPAWAEQYTVTYNGEVYAQGSETGFLTMTEHFQQGDTITLTLPMTARLSPMTDNPDVTAISYGPVALAAVGHVNNGGKIVFASEAEKAAFAENLAAWLEPVDGEPLHFTAQVGEETLHFVPFSEIGRQESTVYFTLTVEEGAASGDNLALGKAAKASEMYSADYSAEKAVDGNPGTRWCVQDADMPQWIMVDLGEETLVTDVVFTPEKAATFQYVIETSKDTSDWEAADGGAGSWEVFADRTGNTTESTYYRDSGSNLGRYVRIRFLGTTTGNPPTWAGMWELEIYSDLTGRLQKTIEAARAIDRDAYVGETDWTAFEAVIAAAEAALEEGSAAQMQALENLSAAISGLTLKVDLSALEQAVELVKRRYDEAGYTPESWTAMAQALAQAEAVLATQGSTTQAAVERALKALDEAAYQLEARPDKQGLAAAIAQAETLRESDYAPQGWQALENALAEARGVLNGENSSAAQVKRQIENLEHCLAALVRYHTADEIHYSVEGGTAKITVSPDRFLSGETVTLEISDIAAGKRFSAIQATWMDPNSLGGLADGQQPLALTTVEAGSKYTFSMPEGEVYVELTLEDVPTEPTKPAPSGYSITVEADHGTVLVRPSRAEAGEIVTVFVTPDEGYELDAITVTTTGGKSILVSGNRFTMPSAAVRVKVTFREIAANGAFVDVDVADWYYDAVSYVAEHGLMDGVGSGKFNPDGAVTRAMVWTVLARMAGEDTDGGSTWYAKAQEWAMETGVSDGTNPMNAITREQLAAMLYRYVGSPAVSGSLDAYPDAGQVSDWAVDALVWATEEEIVNGIGGNLSPKTGATRAQLATMLMRLQENF